MSSHEPRIGIKFAPLSTTAQQMREVWIAADEAGFDHLWILDHFLPMKRSATGWYDSAPTDPIFESWTLLGAMAAVTKRIRIGVNVTGNLYRHPGVLAKMAATVDHLSNGRLEFGIGAAWAEAEFLSLGIPFPPPGERIERLAEACRLIKQLWTEPVANFDGRHYRLTDAISEPKPVQKPYPTFWVGGGGERKTLRVVAEHADIWNIPGTTPDEATRLSGVLDQHCEAVGRDPATIRRSIGMRFDPRDVDGTLRTADEMLGRGFTELIVNVIGDDPARQVRQAAEAMLPRLKGAAV